MKDLNQQLKQEIHNLKILNETTNNVLTSKITNLQQKMHFYKSENKFLREAIAKNNVNVSVMNISAKAREHSKQTFLKEVEFEEKYKRSLGKRQEMEKEIEGKTKEEQERKTTETEAKEVGHLDVEDEQTLFGQIVESD